jgi:hypothetical protein
VSEISKSLWKPFGGFHRDVISMAASPSPADIQGMLYPCRLADRRS